jgi:23S rRNA G2445 N2-methylase RlmL
VSDDIEFSVSDYLHQEANPLATIVTNPPYGNRLQGVDLGAIYDKLKKEITE